MSDAIGLASSLASSVESSSCAWAIIRIPLTVTARTFSGFRSSINRGSFTSLLAFLTAGEETRQRHQHQKLHDHDDADHHDHLWVAEILSRDHEPRCGITLSGAESEHAFGVVAGS